MRGGWWPRSCGFRDLGKSDTSVRELCHFCRFQPVRTPLVQLGRRQMVRSGLDDFGTASSCRRLDGQPQSRTSPSRP